MTSYTIQKHPHGHLVLGPVPLQDFETITKLAPKKSIIHSGVANYYGATLAMGLPDEMRRWQDEIELSLKNVQPPELRFVLGTHVGMSSRTIVAALSTDTQAVAKAKFSNGNVNEPSTPRDAADFSRCHKLLEMVPEWKERMAEVGAKYPETKWPQLAAAWKELTALYEAGKHKELTERISQLEKD